MENHNNNSLNNATVTILVQKMDEAVEKLTEVTGNISKLLSVHEHRIKMAEKYVEEIFTIIEKRREIEEEKFVQVYKTLEIKQKEILTEIKDLHKSNTEKIVQLETTMSKKNEKQDTEINSLRRFQWMVLGGLTVVNVLIAYGPKFLSLLT